ncbi:Transposon Tf2-9 polyprotein [Dictyocoela muelleri]|nr:Transposon Tf2-9 polyprotein [Dictyocoela muelleri]
MEQQADIAKMISDYQINNPTLGTIKNFNHKIHYNSSEIISLTPYKIPINIREQTKKEIKRLLQLKIIQKSDSPFNSPALPILKSNGNVRLVIDYRKINAHTVSDSFPFPEPMDILSDLKGSTIFSQIDLSSGYYQIPMEENSRKYTSFSIYGEHYEFLRMPFGLKNAPRTFQKAMIRLLGHLDFVKIFIDDILIHSPNYETHGKHITEVLNTLRANNISINFDKSRFFQEQVIYLGHIVDKKGTRPDISRLIPFEKLIPSTKKKLQRLLGILNWYRPYIHNLSHKTIELTEKLKDGKKFKWQEKDTEILREIYQEIKRQTLLHFPDMNKPFILESDASDRGIGAVLKQENTIVGLYSAKFNKSEENYSVVEKETLAIVKAVLHFKTIIFNSKIIVKTDNWDLLSIGPLTKRMERWKVILEEFDINIEYLKGANNKFADTFSRLCVLDEPKQIIYNPVSDIKKLQEKHQSTMIYAKKGKIQKHTSGLFVDRNDRIFIPNEAAENFIRNLHLKLVHPGETKLYKTIRRFYFIEKIKQYIREITANCLKCCACKDRTKKYGMIKGSLQGERLLDTVSTDIFGPIKALHFKITKNKEKIYILTFTDLYSRFTTVDILFNISAKAIVESMKENLFNRIGIPKKILSDQGRQYISELFKKTLKSKNIAHILTSAYNPTGNSISERLNKTIADICRIYKGTSIANLKRLIETRINHTYHRALDMSPHEIIFKYSKIDPFKRELKNENKSSNERKINEESVKRINRKRRKFLYKEGDLVFKKLHNPDKIQDLYAGPFKIIKLSEDKNVVLIDEKSKISRQNIKNITPFFIKEGEDVAYRHDPSRSFLKFDQFQETGGKFDSVIKFDMKTRIDEKPINSVASTTPCTKPPEQNQSRKQA